MSGPRYGYGETDPLSLLPQLLDVNSSYLEKSPDEVQSMPCTTSQILIEEHGLLIDRDSWSIIFEPDGQSSVQALFAMNSDHVCRGRMLNGVERKIGEYPFQMRIGVDLYTLVQLYDHGLPAVPDIGNALSNRVGKIHPGRLLRTNALVVSGGL